MTRSSLDDILSTWRERSADSGYNQERVKGTAFEKLCMVYLTHDPTQKTQYEPPVHYGDWARQRGLPETDLGIDLVAKNRGGGRAGVPFSVSFGLRERSSAKQK